MNKPRENQRGNHEWTIQRNWQHQVHKSQDTRQRQNKITMCVEDYYTQANTDNINKA